MDEFNFEFTFIRRRYRVIQGFDTERFTDLAKLDLIQFAYEGLF